MATPDDRIATNMRALVLLEVLAEAERPLTAAELARAADLPRQTVHRVCNTLVDEGFLEREANSRALRPGARLRTVAASVQRDSSFHIARHGILKRVAEQTGETVNFVVPDADGMSYADRVETDWPFRVQLPVGTSVPFHCTASGKTFLASLPTGRRKHLVASLDLSEHTPATLTQADDLLGELEEIARQGFATDREEFMEGMVAVAVPVQDERGRYLASLAFHAPTVRLDIEAALAKRDVLKEGADAIAALMQA